MIRRLRVVLLLLVAGCSQPPAGPLQEIDGFGTNPGELRMLVFVPDSLKPGRFSKSAQRTVSEGNGASGVAPHKATGAPLVVALHGCMQDARSYGEDSGWVELADRLGFLLLLPEQRRGNNLTRCFNWYAPGDFRRDKGEVLSIRQMIERVQRDYAVDPQRIYVTGVSAGAAMTLALAAAYPDVFAGAAPVAGIPFGCADGFFSGLGCMGDPPKRQPAEWGSAVRAASSYKGSWPRVSVWQGDADSLVDPANAEAIVRQWTNVQGTDEAPEEVDDHKGYVHSLYADSNGRPVVESYRIKGMAHGLPVDPGPGETQCGKSGRYFPDVDICSSLYIADFWGLTR